MKKRIALASILFTLVAVSAAPLLAQGFGRAVAVSADDVLVGEAGNPMFPGVVYVYRSADGDWTETARLSASDADGADAFGTAIAADGGLIAIGATGSDAGAVGAGAVYLFGRDDDAWREVATLVASDAAEGDAFGSAVALQDDVLMVADRSKGEGAGAVYLFGRDPSGAWSERAKLTADDVQTFGSSVAIRGDVALIGAATFGFRRGGGGSAGAWVYRRDASGSWALETELTPGDLENGSMFGARVAFDGERALIGAPGLDRRQGALFTFEYDDESGEWSPGPVLRPFDGSPGAQFGASAYAAGDEVWIGAPGANGFEGAVYRLTRDGSGNFAGVTKLVASDPGRRDGFAAAFAMGDAVAVVSLAGDDYGAGTAEIFERPSAEWTATAKIWSEVRGPDAVVGGEVACADGTATFFDCSDVDLVSFLPVRALGGGRGVRVNDIWGWTDPQTGREYALVGMTDRASFVDITDPQNPLLLGTLPMTPGARGSTWRDIKVYNDHAFIVSDGAGEHGMQVFDLTRLREVRDPPVVFEETAHYDRIASAHNIVINESTGFAYSVGSSGGGDTCGGGLHMIDIREPGAPTFAGCFADDRTGRRNTGYSHDAMCVVYEGPDVEHRGKEICFGSNETALSISDVSDKDGPVALSYADYPNVGYAHQGWITEDHRYFYMDDELDEIADARQEGGSSFTGTRTMIWDITDLDDPVLVKEHFGTTLTADHNLYIKGNLMYQSNYNSGLRILDISDPENPVEVGFFDTVPYAESPSMGGSWSNYPYFDSDTIIVTSGNEGLFIVRKVETELIP